MRRLTVAWRLSPTLRADDGEPLSAIGPRTMAGATLTQALAFSGLDQAPQLARPRLLSNNGPSYVSGDFAKWLDKRAIKHSRGAPLHPHIQGKIERWHQTMKIRILLENASLPGDLEQRIAAFVPDEANIRAHESLQNLTPADIYFGRGDAILAERQGIKRMKFANRGLQHQLYAAEHQTWMSQALATLRRQMSQSI
jgi:RNA-directed DNA polymerase